jgi:hypothetical protein
MILSRAFATLVLAGAIAGPALAADPKVDAAIATFTAVAGDAAKVKVYCDMAKAMSAAGDEKDEAKAAAIDKQMADYMAKLGTDFQKAWDTGADVDPESADGKALSTALDKLDSKCGG